MSADDVPAAFTAPAAENPHAGQGQAVVLDIGGDVGAVVVTVPEDLVGREIEIVPEGSRAPGGVFEHAAEHDHHHAHGHDHGHEHGAAHPPHVGVVPRPIGNRLVPTAVFGSVTAGRYELSLRPHEQVALVVDVRGGEVTEAVWPGV